jgi:hypothetical protein
MGLFTKPIARYGVLLPAIKMSYEQNGKYNEQLWYLSDHRYYCVLRMIHE